MSIVTLSDASARQQAVNPELSCIVRAPAGSGKTELLIQRFLSLLGRVERPDEILAITFTRKAAAEMRQRVLDALRLAEQPLPDAAHAQQTWHLARAVVQRDVQRGWRLHHHSNQLQIQTIDSFNAALVRRMPWLSRLGGLPSISDRSWQLYQQAVRQLVHLHHPQPALNTSLRQLLLHLDNRADLLEGLLVQLLARRDQWLRHLVNDAGCQRQVLQQALEAMVVQQLCRLSATLDAAQRQELLELGIFAAAHCADPQRPLCRLLELERFPEPEAEQLAVWQAFADLLLTAQGHFRKRCDKNCGFPPGTAPLLVAMKKRMGAFLQALPESLDKVWHAARQLSGAEYSEQQWQILQALTQVLPQAVAHLWLVFSRSGQVDFTEIALKARQALVESGQPTEQLLLLDHQVQHILIDEFQDTSWLQYDLLKTLTSGWQQGDGRTLFVVGDPMQSIYRFREAEVGLFLQTGRSGVGDLHLLNLQLSANFRSQQGIVDWVNRWFPMIFARREEIGSGAVGYAAAQAVLPLRAGVAVTVTAQNSFDGGTEGRRVCLLIQELLQSCAGQSIAVLVRSRSHLKHILAALRAAGISYHAQDVDALASRSAVLDLVALLRALLHPADHLSALTVLRAPWCGLTLAELSFFPRDKRMTLLEMIEEPIRRYQLSPQAQQRLDWLAVVFRQALAERGRCSLREWIETVWRSLLGAECYTPAECQDVERVLQLLETLDYGGDLLSFEELEDALQRLFAGSSAGDAQVQVMTIHKSKGLEFDHVILPGLGRRPRAPEKTLLRWQEHPEFGLLLAPMAARHENSTDPLYELLGRVEHEKSEHEVARLLYVAVTRAKQQLHLFGHAELDKQQQPQPASGSLLEKLWPAVQDSFYHADGDKIDDIIKDNHPILRRLPIVRITRQLMTSPQCTSVPAEAQLPWLPSVNTAAIVGTVTHHWLEQFAVSGVHHWHPHRIAALERAITVQLQTHGLEASSVPGHCRRILAMLQRTAASDRGRWILAAHDHAACEVEISGVIEGEPRTLIVDRTFVERGVRWIIDYKTSSPASQQSVADFYGRQVEQYRPQLERYARYLLALDPGCRCRCALYFPALDGWVEIEGTAHSAETDE